MPFRTNASLFVPMAAAIVSIVGAAAGTQACGGSESEFTGNDGPDGSTGNNNGNGGGFNGGGTGDGGDTGSWANATCATASADSLRTPIYMQMVLDGSGSMDGVIVNAAGANVYSADARDTDDLNPQRPTIPNGSGNVNEAGQGPPGATGKKWLAARRALYSFWDKLTPSDGTASPDKSFGVGFHVFNSTTVTPDNRVDVAIAAVNAAQSNRLKNRIAPNLTHNGGQYTIGDVYGSGATPLVGAIDGQGAIVRTFTPDGTTLTAGGKRVLVVITDGVPTDANNQPSDAEKTRAITSVTTLKGQSVLTFVIGVGDPGLPNNQYDEVFLGHLAQAGGAAAVGCNQDWNESSPASPPSCHFQITPGDKSTDQLRDEFISAINTIRDTVQSCDFDLKRPDGVPDIDPKKVNVVYTAGSGKETNLKKDPKDGWTYNNEATPTKVLLNGASCNTLKSDPGGKIRIVVGCATDEVKVN